LHDEVAHHERRYVAREVRESVEAVGLEIARLSYFNTILFAPIAVVRLLRRVQTRPPELRSDFDMTKTGRLNEVLARIFASESRLLQRADLPFGISIVALAFKPDSPGSGSR